MTTNNFPTGYQTASKLSEAELEAMTIKELKPLLDGTVPSLYKYRKSALIELILDYTRDERMPKVTPTNLQPQSVVTQPDPNLTTYLNKPTGIEYQVNDKLDECEPKLDHFVFLRDALKFIGIELDNDQFTDFAYKVAGAIKCKPSNLKKNLSYRVGRGKYTVRVYRWDALVVFIRQQFPDHKTEKLDLTTWVKKEFNNK